jgi:hypothetical protein
VAGNRQAWRLKGSAQASIPSESGQQQNVLDPASLGVLWEFIDPPGRMTMPGIVASGKRTIDYIAT